MSGPSAPPPPPPPGYGPPGYGPPPQATPFTPYGVCATFGDRAIASLWDVVYYLPALVMQLVGIFVVAIGAVTWDSTGPVLLIVGGVLLVGGIVLSIVLGIRNYVLDQGRTGTTWGKRKVGILVLDVRTGRPPGAGSCLARYFLHALINQVVYLDYLWCAIDPARLTITDKVLSTVVVKPYPAAPPGPATV